MVFAVTSLLSTRKPNQAFTPLERLALLADICLVAGCVFLACGSHLAGKIDLGVISRLKDIPVDGRIVLLSVAVGDLSVNFLTLIFRTKKKIKFVQVPTPSSNTTAIAQTVKKRYNLPGFSYLFNS